ncbi:MAG TPA: SEC-C domain-containing protein [Streptosporangiaceae bacterium]
MATGETLSSGVELARELAFALRAGDDSAAAGLAAQAGVPPWLLTHRELGPRGQLDPGTAGEALACVAELAAGHPLPLAAWSAEPAVIDLVAEAVETAAALETADGHLWARGIATLEGHQDHAVPVLLRARMAEGSGRSDEARHLIESCLRLDPDMLPAVRDAMEYELCAGNWVRAWELASAIGSDRIAEPLLRPLDRLQKPAPGTERASRNQPCPCGSGHKYKACCRFKDLGGGVHPLPDRAPALYAMLATYAQRGPNRKVADRMTACAIGAPHAAMLALDLTIFDGGIAQRFLTARGHLLRDDERALLAAWLTEPMDMYEVSSVKPGWELSLRSMIGGPQRVWQRDRLFSLSVRRLHIVIGRLLPDGAQLADGGRHVQALGGMGVLPRDFREAGEALFPTGPVAPGSTPLFPERLLSQFAQRSSPVFQNGDGDEYRWRETTIEVAAAGKVWALLTRPCLAPPQPPIRDIGGYYAYLQSLPKRFWTRNSPGEVEYVGQIQPGRLTNLGTIRRGVPGFRVTANSERRAADLEAVVLAAASAAGCAANVVQRSAQTADELTGTPPEAEDQPDSRAATCLRLGITDLPDHEQQTLILEGYFLPIEHPLDDVAREINRELGYLSMLESRDAAGMTPAEAVAAGGAALDRVLARIDDCEWQLGRAEAEGKDTSMLPDPDELRRRLGIQSARPR